MSTYKILVGSYTSVISTLLFSPKANPPSLTITSTSPAGTNPSWISLHPTNSSILFATQENYYGQALTFTLDSAGRATQVASVYSGGQSPAYLAVINGGTELILPNYSSGQVESVPLTNGLKGYGTPSSVLQLTGSGPNTDRQGSSHPHEVNCDFRLWQFITLNLNQRRPSKMGMKFLFPILARTRCGV